MENQRIEAWWSKFREGRGGCILWMNLFKDLRYTGFNRDDYLTKECLKFYNSTRTTSRGRTLEHSPYSAT